MDSFLPPVVALLLADIKGFKAGMGEARGEMAATNSAFSKLGAYGKVAMLALAGVAIAVGVYSVHAASQFDAAMERVHTQAGATQVEVDALKGSVLGLAGQTAQSPEDLALGLYHLESAGFRGAQAMDLLKYAAEGATIGHANLENVTQAMIATVASGIPGVHGAADAMALLNRTVGIGDMKMQGLTAAMSTGILPTARVAGLAFNDVAAALATVTDNAQAPDEAATRLRMSFAMMAGPSGAAAKALRGIGLNSTDLAKDMRKPDGLLVALEDLKGHLDKLPGGFKGVAANQALVHSFGGGRSSGTIMLLLTQMDRLKTKYHELGTAGQRAKDFQDAWASTQAQFATKVQQIRAAVEALAIRIGEFLIPWLVKAGDLFVKGVTWLQNHRQAMIALGIVIGTVLVAGLVAATAAVVAFTFALVTDPVFLVVAAIAALAYGIYYAYGHFETFRNIVNRVWSAIKSFTETLWAHRGVLLTVAQAIGGAVIGALHALGAAWSWVKGVASSFAGWISSWLGPFVGWWQSRWGQIKTVLQSVWAFIVMDVKVTWAVLSAVIRVAVGLIVTILKVAWDIIVGIFKIAWDIISTVVKVAWDILSGIVRVGWAIIRGIFETALDLLTGHWSQAWHDITHMFSTVFGTIVDAASNVLSNLRSGILNAVKDFGSMLWNAGADLIKGLINGVKSLATNAIGAVKDVASGMVNGVKSILHINSPSRVFHDIGAGMMEGLTNGIVANAHHPALAMHQAMLGVVGNAGLSGSSASSALSGFHSLLALRAGSGSGLATAASTAGPVLQVTVPVAVDGRVLFEVMQEQTLTYGSRNLNNGLTPAHR